MTIRHGPGKFIGHQREIDQFTESLDRFTKFGHLRARLAGRTADPSRVFLPYGISGIGKTWLSQQCLTLAHRKGWNTIEIDCDQIILRPTEPTDLMNAIVKMLSPLYGEKTVDAYLATRRQTRTARQRIDRLKAENQETWARLDERARDVTNSTTNDSPTAAQGTTAHSNVEAAFLNWALEQDLLTQDDVLLYNNANARLGDHLSEALIAAAQKGPLVVLFDHCEALPVAFQEWLRDAIVCPASSQRAPLLFIISGQIDQFNEREFTDVHGRRRTIKGYADRLPAPLPLAWNLTRYAEPEVRAFLDANGLPADDIESELAQTISRGIPYVLSAFVETVQHYGLETARHLFPPSELSCLSDQELVNVVSRRVRHHCVEQAHLHRIITLALLLRPDHDALTVLWDLSDEIPPQLALSQLAARYSFTGVDGRLHSVMKQLIRDELRQDERALASQLGQAAAEYYRLQWLAYVDSFSSTSERLESSTGIEIALQYLNALLWHNAGPAAAFLAARFTEAMLFDHGLAYALLNLAEEFTLPRDWWTRQSHRLFRILRQILEVEGLDRLDPLNRLLRRADKLGLSALHKACIHFRRAQVLLTADRPLAALDACQKADNLMSEDFSLRTPIAELYNLIGWKLCLAKDQAVPWPQVEGAFRRALMLQPNTGHLHIGLGVALHGLKRSSEAIETLKTGIEIQGERVYSLNALGTAYSDLRQYDQALAALQRAIELDPDDARLHNNLGTIYHGLQQFDQAIIAFQRAIELDPNDAAPHNNLGTIYLSLQQYDQAVTTFQCGIELDPNDAYLHFNMGLVSSALRQHRQAIAAFQRGIELDPQNARAHIKLGDNYSALKQHNQAIAAFQRASELAPTSPHPHYDLGNVYRELKQFDRAIAAYRHAIELDPDDADSHKNLGHVYRVLVQYDQAIAALARAIELDPEDASSHYNLGLVYHDLNRHNQAIASYQRAIELDPDNAAAYQGLAIVYRHLKQYDQAITSYQRAIELDPKDASLYANRGIAYNLAGDHDQAEADYSHALELNPETGWIYASLASLHRHRGDRERHAAFLAAAQARISPDNDYSQACLASIAGDVDSAISYLARALEQNPDRCQWARQDPDLDWIRADARYQSLVGEDEDMHA